MPFEDDTLPPSAASSSGEARVARIAELEQHARVREIVLSSIADFAYTFDREGRFLFANQALLSLWGRELKDVVGKNFFDLHYPPELAATLQRQIREVIETKQRVKDRTPYTSESGQAGFYEYILAPVLGGDGEVEFVAGSTRDITDTENALAAARRSEEDFRQLADAMPQIVWGARPDGTLDYYNRRWFEYIEIRPEDAALATWDRHLHPEDLPPTAAAWAEALQIGNPYSVEFRVRRGDGVYRWFLARALPIRDDKGVVARWFGTCTDIQDQKELQARKEALLASERAARSSAEHASRMKDEFLATLSHELRTPLNAIFGWTQLLKQSLDDPETLAEGIDVIDRNVRMQRQLIEDLLDMSRIISGKLRLDVQQLEPGGCIEAAIETVTPAARAKEIRITKVLDPLEGPMTGDPARLQQMIWNLLSNAIKFTPRGGSVQVALERVESHLELSVTDTGQGISAEFLPHVFDRFRQADAAMNRKHGGLGLGLAIVKQLAELHGGAVRVKSAGAGQGATFTVSFPLNAVRLAVEADERRPSDAAVGAPAGCAEANIAGLKILVLDDGRDARELLRRVLEDCDADVAIAATAAEAMLLIQSQRPDVLISDIGMPEVDGFQFLQMVRALPAEAGGKTPAVALTAFARSEDRTRVLLAGFLAHVAKPVEPAELIATIAAVAGRTSAEP